MGRIKWLPSMSIGVPEWDAEHVGLLDLINRLDRLTGPAADEFADIMAALEDYADGHLSSEEFVMDRLGYPDSGAHRVRHGEFRAWMKQARRGLEETPGSDFRRQVTEYLIGWWYAHIIREDGSYREFFADRRGDVQAALRLFRPDASIGAAGGRPGSGGDQ